jgi:hypothetical protein
MDFGCSWKSDTTVFLFTLTNPYNIPSTEYLIKPGNVENSVYHNGAYGSTFGAGHNIQLANASNSNNSSYAGFPNRYADTTGKGNNTFTGARNFTTSDVEVSKPA